MEIPVDQKIKYLNRRLDEVAELNECLLSGNYEPALMIGHRLKGNGETFGFPLISKIGISLELAAQAKDEAKLRESILKLKLNVDENLNNLH